jgi:hypothetical protein
MGGWLDYGGVFVFALRLVGQQLTIDLVEIGGYKRYLFTNLVSLAAGNH